MANGRYVKRSREIINMYLRFHKECREGKITLQDDDISVVEAMIQFMYNLDYSVIESVCPLLFNAKVYGIADKYNVPGLKVVAKRKFAHKISCRPAKPGYGYNVKVDYTTTEIDNFSKAVIEVYDSTPSSDRGLRDILVTESCQEAQKFLGNDSFQKVMADCHGFCLDLATYMGKRQGPRYR